MRRKNPIHGGALIVGLVTGAIVGRPGAVRAIPPCDYQKCHFDHCDSTSQFYQCTEVANGCAGALCDEE